MGTVLHLAYYFAATGDRLRARALWREFMTAAKQNSAQPANPAVGILLDRKRYRRAFLEMRRDDQPLIMMYFDPYVRDTKFIQAVDAGIGGDFAGASRSFMIDVHCFRREYGYYGAGVAEFALGDRHAALNAWLAATLAQDHPMPDQPSFGEVATRAVALLLRFF